MMMSEVRFDVDEKEWRSHEIVAAVIDELANGSQF